MKRLPILALAATLAACGPTVDFDATVDVRDASSPPRDVQDATVSDVPNAMDSGDVTDASSTIDALDVPTIDAPDVTEIDAPDVMVVADVRDTAVSDASDSAVMDARDVIDATTPVDTGVDATPFDVRTDTGIADTGIADTGIADTGIRDTGIADTGIGDTGIGDMGVVVAPVVNGVIAANEYGSHVEGQNQRTETATSVTWFMRWTDTTLYVALTGANLAEGTVLYLGSSVAGSAGTAMDGTLQGFSTYDNTRLNPLPFRATFVVYFKNGYQELRRWDGVSAWGAPVTTGITYASNATGNVREIAIPWTLVRPAGRPASFGFTGYVTSMGGFAYGEMPPENPGGNIGLNAVFPNFYRVADSAPIGGTLPFSLRAP
jgi:hypothetical protein